MTDPSMPTSQASELGKIRKEMRAMLDRLDALEGLNTTNEANDATIHGTHGNHTQPEREIEIMTGSTTSTKDVPKWCNMKEINFDDELDSVLFAEVCDDVIAYRSLSELVKEEDVRRAYIDLVRIATNGAVFGFPWTEGGRYNDAF